MKKRIVILVTLLFTLCFGVSSFAATITLPQPTGAYRVGTRRIELTDTSRKMLRDSTQRRWMMQAFYPTDTAQLAKLILICLARLQKA